MTKIENNAEASDTYQEAETIAFPHFNVLLVEDSAPNVLAASALLKSEEYSFNVARSGEEALSLFQAAKYDLILMDLKLPELSGLDATKEIRRLEKEKGMSVTPVIIMTGNIANRDMQESVEAGVDDIIPKPFHPEYFKATLQKYCSK